VLCEVINLKSAIFFLKILYLISNCAAMLTMRLVTYGFKKEVNNNNIFHLKSHHTEEWKQDKVFLHKLENVNFSFSCSSNKDVMARV